MNKTLQSRLYQQLEMHPGRPALAFVNHRVEFDWLTVEDVHAKARGYAQSLCELGVSKDDVCILVLPSNPFCALTLLATLLLNAIPLLVAPPTLQGFNPYLLQVLRRIIRKTGAKIVIAPESMAEMRTELQKIRTATRIVIGENELPPTAVPDSRRPLPGENDIAALQLTSGTTGFPRICVWQQENVIRALDGMAQAMHVGENDIYLNWTPLYHDMGLVNNFLLCLSEGIPLAMLSPLDFVKKPALWLQALSATGATTTWSPNFGFAITTKWARERELKDVRLGHVKGFWNAAERIHLQTVQAFYERFAAYGLRYEALKTNFGCAENVGGATFSDVKGTFVSEWVDLKSLYNKRIARVVQPAENGKATAVVGVGRPHPGIQIRILNRRGQALPDGHVGEIALQTPSRMTCYLGQNSESRKALDGEWLRTGDLGYLRDGELFWVGRVKERMNVRGKKLDPSDFERVLLNISGLRTGCFVVFGVDNPQSGTQEVVIVSEVREPAEQSFELISEEIKEKVSLQLGVQVSDIVFVRKGTLSKTSSGKRRHLHYRQLYLDGKLDSLFRSREDVVRH